MKRLKLKPIISRGNSLYIQSYPVVGVLSLISFLDFTEQEDSERHFDKFFRYSNNGVDYSEWTALTLENISRINLNSKRVSIFEFRYDKVEKAGENKLKLNKLDVDYTEDTVRSIQNNYFENSLFKNFFESDDIRVLDWYVNVLNKLYKKGMVPDFISRGKTDQEKTDYLQFWGSVAKFFAYFVVLAKHFEEFNKDENLLLEFLKQRGIKISQTVDYEIVSLLTKDFLVNFTKRGTRDIYRKKKDQEKYDGELLRLIGYKEGDEFLFIKRQCQEIGWNIGNSSPLYRGMFSVKNSNKFYENKEFKDTEQISVDFVYKTDWFIIDSKLDYHLYLEIKGDSEFKVEVEGVNENNQPVSCVSYKDGSESNVFVERGKMFRGDKTLPVSLFLYNNEKKIFSDDSTTIKQGNDLISKPETKKVRFIVSGSNLIISKRVFSVLKTPYSHGLVQVKNIIDTVLKNNNYSMSFKEIHLFIEKYLIPYNHHLLDIDLNDERIIKETLEEEKVEIIKTKWVEGEGYCEVTKWRGINPVCEMMKVRWIGDDLTAYCKKVVDGDQVVYNGELHYLWLVEVDENNKKTGRVKINLPDDPDYVRPILNHFSCQR